MVTTTVAPPPFWAHISAGPEDPQRFSTSLLQSRLRRAAGPGEKTPQPGPGLLAGPAAAAGKRARRRRGKIRPGPASRFQQYQHHRAGLGRRNAAQGTRHPYLKAEGLEAAPSEEGSLKTALPVKPLGKEVRRRRRRREGRKEAVPRTVHPHPPQFQGEASLPERKSGGGAEGESFRYAQSAERFRRR